MPRLFFLALALFLAACGASLDDVENGVLCRTAGWLNQDTREWLLRIHGWVFETAQSTARNAVVESSLEETVGVRAYE